MRSQTIQSGQLTREEIRSNQERAKLCELCGETLGSDFCLYAKKGEYWAQVVHKACAERDMLKTDQ